MDQHRSGKPLEGFLTGQSFSNLKLVYDNRFLGRQSILPGITSTLRSLSRP